MMTKDRKNKIFMLELVYPRTYEYEDPRLTKKRKELGVKTKKVKKAGRW